MKYEPWLTSNLAAPPRKNFGSSTILDALIHLMSYPASFHSNCNLEFSVYKDLSDGVKVKSSNNFSFLRHLQGNIYDLSRKNSLNKSHLLHAYYPRLISRDEWILLVDTTYFWCPDTWIPWILEYHGYLDTMDTPFFLDLWILGYYR